MSAPDMRANVGGKDLLQGGAFKSVRSMWQERASAQTTPPVRAHTERLPGQDEVRGRWQTKKVEEEVEVPLLWRGGETPRVDEQGRVVLKTQSASKHVDYKQAVASEESPISEFPSMSSEGDDADSTLNLSFGSREQSEMSSPCNTTDEKSDVDAPKELLRAQENIAVTIAGTEGDGKFEMCVAVDSGAPLDVTDEDDEVWSPTIILSPAGQRASDTEQGQEDLPQSSARRENSNKKSSLASHKLNNSSFMEFGCDHENATEHESFSFSSNALSGHNLDARAENRRDDDSIREEITVPMLGASMNPPTFSASLSPSPRRGSTSPDCEERSSTPNNQERPLLDQMPIVGGNVSTSNSTPSTNFTPRRARSVAESNAAKVALTEANAALARLSASPLSSSTSQTTSPSISVSPSPSEQRNVGQTSVMHDILRIQQVKIPTKNDIDLSDANQCARPSNQLEGLRQCVPDQNARVRVSSALSSSKIMSSTMQSDERRRFELKICFLEEELEKASTELSNTKARLSSSDIELQVLRTQFEKIDRKSVAWTRDRGLYSSNSSRELYSSTVGERHGANDRQQDIDAQLDMAAAERRALEKGMQSLHSHAANLREENLALHQSLQEALAKLAFLGSEMSQQRGVQTCPTCGTEMLRGIGQPEAKGAGVQSVIPLTPESMTLHSGKENKWSGQQPEMRAERDADILRVDVEKEGLITTTMRAPARTLRQWNLKDTKMQDQVAVRELSECDHHGMQNPEDTDIPHVFDTSCESL